MIKLQENLEAVAGKALIHGKIARQISSLESLRANAMALSHRTRSLSD
jgi:hypothetical protein